MICTSLPGCFCANFAWYYALKRGTIGGIKGGIIWHYPSKRQRQTGHTKQNWMYSRFSRTRRRGRRFGPPLLRLGSPCRPGSFRPRGSGWPARQSRPHRPPIKTIKRRRPGIRPGRRRFFRPILIRARARALFGFAPAREIRYCAPARAPMRRGEPKIQLDFENFLIISFIYVTECGHNCLRKCI